MDRTDVLIIGGGPAGIVAALKAKQYYPDKDVLVVRGTQRQLIPCALPYTYKNVQIDQDVIPDALYDQYGVRLRIADVLAVDWQAHEALLTGGEKISYEKVVLATGSKPVIPPIPGVEKENVMPVYKDSWHVQRLQEAARQAERIVFIGGGFISLEFAEEYAQAGKHVTIIERMPHVLSHVLDAELAQRVQEELARLGVTLKLNTTVKEILGERKAHGVRLETGEDLPADLIILAVGAMPNIDLAVNSGIPVEDGMIRVNQYYETPVPDVFAAGDCAYKRDLITGKPVKALLASVAVMEATIAALNLYERRKARHEAGIVAPVITKIGRLTIGSVGITSEDAEQHGMAYEAYTMETVDRHPQSLPDHGREWTRTLINTATGEFLGFQIVAEHSYTAGMIDLVGMLIRHEHTIWDVLAGSFASHPKLTPSPVMDPVLNAAAQAAKRMSK